MLLSILPILAVHAGAPSKPLSLLPSNPHYFLFWGKPTVLITSGEHYGAVLNKGFDYVRYLETLKADNLNLTRTFSGVYREIPGNFNIRENTLAPKNEDYICPWKRTSTPGALDGMGKFDLNQWDPAYFKRLKDFMTQAARRGVVVEMNLFCPFYEDAMWNASPMNAANNVNGIGNIARTEAYNLKHPDLQAVQDAVTRKIVGELSEFDNLYYEICNEPYFGGVTLAWQRHISQVIVEAELGLGHKHLISQNIANGSQKITDPDPNVSIFNFHYAAPPNAVTENYHLNKPVGFNETGFAGSADATYRSQAWHFMLAGGALFNNLDYSFTAAKPDGTMPVTAPTPGGGSPELRKQLSVLKFFFDSIKFDNMLGPSAYIPRLPENSRFKIHSLRNNAPQYAAYLEGKGETELILNAPFESIHVEWIDPSTGKIVKKETITGEKYGVEINLRSPPIEQDMAVRINFVKQPPRKTAKGSHTVQSGAYFRSRSFQ